MWRRKERGGEGGKSSAMDSPIGSGSEEADDQWRDEDPNWQQRELHICGSLLSHRISVNYFLRISQIFYWKMGGKCPHVLFSVCFLFKRKQTSSKIVPHPLKRSVVSKQPPTRFLAQLALPFTQDYVQNSATPPAIFNTG